MTVPLKAIELFLGMGAAREGELDLCEECGAPLQDGFCFNCADGFREGASPVGAAPLDRSELSKVLRRPVGPRAHGSYALSMQQEQGMAPLRKQIDLLVEQFNASQVVKASVKQTAERLAVKIMDDLGPTKAAVASVAQEFLRTGRDLAEVSSCIGRLHPGLDRLKDLVFEVLPASSGEIAVLVNGRKRPFRSYANGLYRKLRIPLFSSDGGALVALENALLTRNGYDSRRVEPIGPSEFRVRADESSFELFKVLVEAKLSGSMPDAGTNPSTMLRRYSISKLLLTERLLREAGLLQQVTAEYARSFAQKAEDGRGRSPRKLAEEALAEACENLVPESLSNSLVRKYHLRPSAVHALLLKAELEAWRG